MKSVLVVGAGPAGLVAAKSLLHAPSAKFDVTVLEQKDRVGGMWAVEPPGSKTNNSGRVEPGWEKCSAEMRTNLSRFTVAFSDFSWHNVEFEKGKTGDPPMFPKAWQVGRYLQAYAKEYIPDGVVNLGCTVTSAERVTEGRRQRWKVQWMAPPHTALRKNGANGAPDITQIVQSGATFYQAYFDYIVAAAGFFNKPNRPSFLVPDSYSGKVLHSSEFRHLDDLELKPGTKGNIVVVGGGMSGSETSSTLATQLSSAKYAPGPDPGLDGLSIYHVTKKPFYDLPRYLPRFSTLKTSDDAATWDPAPSFTPLDLHMYDIGRRPKAPAYPITGRLPADKAESSHKFIRSLIGGDQSDLGHKELVSAETTAPAHVGITDTYSQFVKSGTIVPVKGRAMALQRSKNEGQEWAVSVDASASSRSSISSRQDSEVKTASSSLDPSSSVDTSDEIAPRPTYVPNVVAVIYANGFSPDSALRWLSSEVREELKYNPDSRRLPLLLQRYQVFRDDIPNIGFIGFYEGPFWGVMEMQAKFLVEKWSADHRPHPQRDEDLLTMTSLRTAMLQYDPTIPQFWMGDYVGVVEGIAQELHISRDDSLFPSGGGLSPCVPARYVNKSATEHQKAQSEAILKEIRALLDKAEMKGRFVAAAVFRGMQGTWNLRRTITSRLADFPSGSLEGTAWLHPRAPTAEGYDAEYLYVETGKFRMDTGFEALASRRYVYRYDAAKDSITKWFVKADDEKSVDYFFSELELDVASSSERRTGWFAKGKHLCEEDMYHSEFEWRFRGATMDKWRVTYEVKGPQKDYTSVSWYER